jgi:hypothetical protein
MYRVKYLYEENARNRRIGRVIPLSLVTRLVQLVPKFSSLEDRQLSAHNSMDICPEFYINPFMDKETYQAVW